MYRNAGWSIIVLALVAMLGHRAVADDAAARLYKSKCSNCHGKTGDGKTTTGRKLGVKDWTDGKALRDLSDAEIKTVVVAGVKGTDGKWKMAPFPKLSDADIAAVATYIRGLAKR